MATRKRQRHKATQRRYRKTPKGRYQDHKQHAKGRRVIFNLTFVQWWAIWETSGRWEERGNRKGKYCMARLEDRGGYEEGNVRIELYTSNTATRNRTCRVSRDLPDPDVPF